MTNKSMKKIYKRPLTAILCTAGMLFTVAGAPLSASAESGTSSRETPSILELAKAEAQTFSTPDDVKIEPLVRSSYSATTPEELKKIQEKKEAKRKAEEEKKRKAEELKQITEANVAKINNVTSAEGAKMEGHFAWPLTSFTSDPQINGFRTGTRPGHDGFDLIAPARTPIYAATDGVVITSSESHYGFGVAVVIETVIDGVAVQTTYGHMTNGTRAVEAGDTVKAGDQIGQVGNTGHSFGDHLHFEVRLNGTLVDPAAWLRANLE